MLEILSFFLADDYKLGPGTTRELCLRETMAMELTDIMDIYCSGLMEVTTLLEVTKVTHHTLLGLCGEGVNTLREDNTDIYTSVKG